MWPSAGAAYASSSRLNFSDFTGEYLQVTAADACSRHCCAAACTSRCCSSLMTLQQHVRDCCCAGAVHGGGGVCRQKPRAHRCRNCHTILELPAIVTQLLHNCYAFVCPRIARSYAFNTHCTRTQSICSIQPQAPALTLCACTIWQTGPNTQSSSTGNAFAFAFTSIASPSDTATKHARVIAVHAHTTPASVVLDDSFGNATVSEANRFLHVSQRAVRCVRYKHQVPSRAASQSVVVIIIATTTIVIIITTTHHCLTPASQKPQHHRRRMQASITRLRSHSATALPRCHPAALAHCVHHPHP